MFSIAQKRLAILEKWFLPIFSFLIAAYQAGIGLYLLKGVSDSNPAIGKQPLLCAVCMVAVAFVMFPALTLRYRHVKTAGMETASRGRQFAVRFGNFVFCPGDSPCPGPVQNISL